MTETKQDISELRESLEWAYALLESYGRWLVGDGPQPLPNEHMDIMDKIQEVLATNNIPSGEQNDTD